MWLFIIINIIADGIIVYFIPSYFNNINLFYPMLTVTLIPLLYGLYNKDEYYRISFIIGVIYDLLYSSIFLYNALIFLLLSKINSKFYKIFNDNLFFKLILVIINIIIYDVINYILILITNYQQVEFISLIYKIKNSLVLNILVIFVYYFLFKKRKIKHKV